MGGFDWGGRRRFGVLDTGSEGQESTGEEEWEESGYKRSIGLTL